MSNVKDTRLTQTNLNQLDILDNKWIEINPDFVITLSKENFKNIDQSICKILNFSADWKFDEILHTISKLDSKSYPHLFIFLIKIKTLGFSASKQNQNLEKVELLQNFIIQFCQNRPIILQLTSIDEKQTKFYYKEENCKNYICIEEKLTKLDEFEDFSTFFILFLNTKLEKLESQILEKLPKLTNSSIVLKLLNSINLTGSFYIDLILKCASRCKTKDLLAIIDGFIDEDGKTQGTNLDILSKKINLTSVLHTAVLGSNREVLEFLIKKCSDYIQELEFEHQIEVSTAAFATNQLDVLHDLIQICDFPFPNEFNPETLDNNSLYKLIQCRVKFHDDIIKENIEDIKKFAKTYPNLKLAYNLKNKSAFCQALDSKKYNAFYKLKALRFYDHSIKYQEYEDKDENLAIKFAKLQQKENVNSSAPNEQKSISLLSMRSYIYKRDDCDVNDECNIKIKEWYKQIYSTKLGSKIIDAASQCEKLKIIFDFECDSVENADVCATSAAIGIIYPGLKYIFIGAKLTNEKEREQYVKGVIAHEICHYVMCLVYENNANPYYKGDTKTKNEFDEVVTATFNMLINNNGEEDLKSTESSNESFGDVDIEEIKLDNDQCKGTISSVYEFYDEEICHQELIVRPAQILAQFDHEPEKIDILENKYKLLFQFCNDVVIPELEQFNMENREKVKNFNNMISFASKFENSKIEFSNPNELNQILNNQIVIITSNIPRLLLIEIYKHLKEQNEILLYTKNIFINSDNLDNSYVNLNLKDLLSKKLNLNIFVDCSMGFGKITEILPLLRESKIAMVISEQKQNNELCSHCQIPLVEELKIASEEKQNNKLCFLCQNNKINTETLNYNWLDISIVGQSFLLETKVNFQNNFDFSLSDLILNNVDKPLDLLYKTEEMIDLIDNETLNLLVEKSKISINLQNIKEVYDQNFKILFQTRNLIKNYKIIKSIEKQKSVKFSDIILFKQRKVVESKKLTRQKSFQNAETDNDQIKDECAIEVHFEEVEKSEKMSQDQIIEEVKNQKYVLISDKAGSGKSWMIKSFMTMLREVYPKNWIVFVDLKQHIKKFKNQKSKINFLTFVTNKLMQFKSKFEEKLFKMFYKKGQVSIYFDGFDEIAPDCASFVTKLFQSFEQNGTNQMWIATRDFFEVNLKKELDIQVVYKLDEFTEKHGIDLIASSWMLSEIRHDISKQSKIEILKSLKSSPDFKKYLKIARKINRKVSRSQNVSIGSPQFYKMVGEILKSNKKSVTSLTTFKVFEQCVNIQYERWSQEKGELRMKANTESQNKELNFQKLHQLIAMESLFPSESVFCDLDLEDFDWCVEEVIACGLLCMIGEKFFFSHETFREYHVAKFIIRILTKPKFDKNICVFLVEILTVTKFAIVRMFLNEALSQTVISRQIDSKIPKIAVYFVENVKDISNLSQMIEENLKYLVDLLIKILRFGSYEQIKEIIFENDIIIKSAIKNKKIFFKVQDFIIDFLQSNDLIIFLSKNSIICSILKSNLHVNTTELFIQNIVNKLGLNFLIESIQTKGDFNKSFFHSILIEDGSDYIFKKALRILDIFLESGVLLQIIELCNDDEENLIYACLENFESNKLSYLFATLSKHVLSEEFLKQFKKILLQNIPNENFNIIQVSSFCTTPEFQNNFWVILKHAFENREELKEILVKNLDDNDMNITSNYLKIASFVSKEDSFKVIVENMRQVFNEVQLEEIFNSFFKCDENFLSIVVKKSEELILSFPYLWNFVKSICKSNEIFMEYIEKIDGESDNLLYSAVRYSKPEIFDFIIKDLEKMTTKNRIKKLLATSGECTHSFLHVVAKYDKTYEFNKTIWTTIQKYFDPIEIIDMIVKTDKDGNDLLIYTLKNTSKEIVEQVWNEIGNIMFTGEYFEDLLSELQNECYIHLITYLEDTSNKDSMNIFKEKWDNFLNKFKIFNSNKIFGEVLSSDHPPTDFKILHRLTPCDVLQYFTALWDKLLIDSTQLNVNKESIKNLIIQKDNIGNNFIHLLLLNENQSIIKYSFNFLKTNLSSSQYNEIIRSRGKFNRNMLQIVLYQSNNFELFKYLWEIIQESCNSNDVYQIIFDEFDFDSNNLVRCAACQATGEMFEFLVQELEKITKIQELKVILGISESPILNIFQLAVKNNNNVDLHISLWKVMQKYLSALEILDIISQTGDDNVTFINAVIKSSKVIAELVWNQLKNIILSNTTLKKKLFGYWIKCNIHLLNLFNDSTDEDESQMLITAWKDLIKNFKICESYLLVEMILNQEISIKEFKILRKLAFCDIIDFHEAIWKIMFCNFENKEELKNLILKIDAKGHNFLDYLLMVNEKAEIIEFTFEVFNENFSSNQYQEIFKVQHNRRINILSKVQKNLQDFATFQKLWKILRSLYKKKNEELLEILKKVDSNNLNFFHIAVGKSPSEVIEFIFNELETIASDLEIKEILLTNGFRNGSLLNEATYSNKSIISNENLWLILTNHLNSFEIIDLINHTDGDGDNILHNAVFWNNVEVVKLTWKNITKHIDKQDDLVKYLKSFGHEGKNLLELSLKNQLNDSNVKIWVENIMTEYQIQLN